jgi:ribosomal protein S21
MTPSARRAALQATSSQLNPSSGAWRGAPFPGVADPWTPDHVAAALEVRAGLHGAVLGQVIDDDKALRRLDRSEAATRQLMARRGARSREKPSGSQVRSSPNARE